MYLVAHGFGRDEYRIFVVVFFQAGSLEKTKTIIRYSKFDTSKSMSYQDIRGSWFW